MATGGNWRTHIKSEFFINNKNAENENPGESIKVVLKQDYKWNKFKFYIANKFTYTSEKKDSDNSIINNSYKYSLLHLFGVNYSITKQFKIQSKYQFPSMVKGGSKYNQKLLLSFVYYFNFQQKNNK